MKKPQLTILFSALLLGITSCGPAVTSLSNTITPSVSTTLTTSGTLDNFYLETEEVAKTARLKYSNKDRISSDLLKGFSPLMVAAKSLLNSNKKNTTWNQEIKGEIISNPFISMQRTSILASSIYYEEATLFGFGDTFGRKINAYTNKDDFSFGRSSLRTFDSSMLSSSLLLEEKDLFKANRKTISDQIGIFEEIYDLIPINKFTVITSDITPLIGEKYKIDVDLNIDTSLQNLFKRLGLGKISLGDIILSPVEEALKATYIVDNDYKLLSIDYKTNDAIKLFSLSSKVSFDTISAIEGSKTLEAAFTKTEFETTFVFDQLKISTTSLLAKGLNNLILKNALPIKMPLTFSITHSTLGVKTINGLLEFKVKISLDNILDMEEMLKVNDFKGIVGVLFEKIKFNIFLDISALGDPYKELLISFSNDRGVMTFTSLQGQPLIKEFTKQQALDIISALLPTNDSTPLEQLIEMVNNSITPENLDNFLEFSKILNQNYNTKINEFLENKTTFISYIDAYYSKDLLSLKNLEVTPSSVDFSLPEDFEVRLTNFLNGNGGVSPFLFNNLLGYLLGSLPSIPTEITSLWSKDMRQENLFNSNSILSFSLKNKESDEADGGAFHSLSLRLADPRDSQKVYDLMLGPTEYFQNSIEFIEGKYFPN